MTDNVCYHCESCIAENIPDCGSNGRAVGRQRHALRAGAEHSRERE